MGKEKSIEFVSEADLQHKIILPYLTSLGFSPEEITLEKTFTIKLGKKQYLKESQKSISGRLDILCRKSNKNLFVIETKRKQDNFSNEDVEQGISYARLLDNIAPFVILTNGSITKVYDTIKKEEIAKPKLISESNFWKNNCILSIEDDLKFRFDALKNFIGYSPENLKAFSNSQIEDRMQPLKGNKDQLSKKYIPEIFLKRKDLIDVFRNFIESDKQCFAMIGESGVGKTNYICGLTEYFKKNHISFFFNVPFLIQDIIYSIKEDFNWIFSPNLESAEIFKRIESLAENCNRKVLFFFDAIDESPIPNFNLDINDFVRKLKNFKNIKVCVTCKESEWYKFIKIKDTPSYISESLYETKSNISKKNQIPGYKINRFNDNEISKLEKFYQKYFNYSGLLTGDSKEECKLGFMLRLVAEVYQDQELPNTINKIKIFDKFLYKKLEKISNSNLARVQLIKIGEILYNQEIEGRSSGGLIKDETLRDLLNLRINEEITTELFSYNLLTQVVDNEGRKFIGFYQWKICSYIVSIHVLKLHKSNDDEFRVILPILLRGGIGQDALKWYITIANHSHINIINDFQNKQAVEFLTEYISIIDNHFANLKEYFEPRTNNNIGLIVGSLPDVELKGYGFIPLKKNERKKIKYIKSNSTDEMFQMANKLGSSVFYYDRYFFYMNPKKLARDHILSQLKHLVEKGTLNESRNINITMEKIFSILYCYGKKLELDADQDSIILPNINSLPTKDFEEILQKIKLFYAKTYIENKILEKFGMIEYSKKTISQIRNDAIAAIKKNIQIPEPNISGSFPPSKVLKKMILELLDQNIKSIFFPLIEPDITSRDKALKKIRKDNIDLNNQMGRVIASYSNAQLKKYIELFFILYLKEYKKLVETCFPRFKHKMELYKKLPIHLYIEVKLNKYLEYPLWSGIKSINNMESTVEINFNPKSKTLLREEKKFDLISCESLTDIFISRDHYPLDPNVDSYQANRMCVLRNRILGTIEKEIKNLIERNDI